jgi:hypothetical protein
MKTVKLIGFSLNLLSFGSVALVQAQADTPIPSEYQSLHDSLVAQENHIAYANLRQGILSPTGEALQELLAGL